jgi:hypothetical protein
MTIGRGRYLASRARARAWAREKGRAASAGPPCPITITIITTTITIITIARGWLHGHSSHARPEKEVGVRERGKLDEAPPP